MVCKINSQTDGSSLLSEAEPGRLVLDEQSRESSLGEKSRLHGAVKRDCAWQRKIETARGSIKCRYF